MFVYFYICTVHHLSIISVITSISKLIFSYFSLKKESLETPSNSKVFNIIPHRSPSQRLIHIFCGILFNLNSIILRHRCIDVPHSNLATEASPGVRVIGDVLVAMVSYGGTGMTGWQTVVAERWSLHRLSISLSLSLLHTNTYIHTYTTPAGI